MFTDVEWNPCSRVRSTETLRKSKRATERAVPAACSQGCQQVAGRQRGPAGRVEVAMVGQNRSRRGREESVMRARYPMFARALSSGSARRYFTTPRSIACNVIPNSSWPVSRHRCGVDRPAYELGHHHRHPLQPGPGLRISTSQPSVSSFRMSHFGEGRAHPTAPRRAGTPSPVRPVRAPNRVGWSWRRHLGSRNMSASPSAEPGRTDAR